jgi:glucosamine 6-phosphate synthetase-like amidotransferase/phosphosugar isomerase protein
MCGIFGSTDKERFLTLYELNKQRGTFATSVSLVLENGDLPVIKWEGSPTVKAVLNQIKSIEKTKKISSYLGHTQAPTSAKRKYDRVTSHPFNEDGWTVAHNGVLSNFDDLKENLATKWENPVDSSIIPHTINVFSKDGNPGLVAVTRSLSLLEGTFGLWLYHSDDSCTYIARCGSILFANLLNNDFSSIKFKGSETLEEGIVYQVTREGLTTVGQFDFDSPFFT